MNTTNNCSIVIPDKVFKIKDIDSGFCGFVQPGSGYAIGCFECKDTTMIGITNTGSTELTFQLFDNGSAEHLINCMVLQPGEQIRFRPGKMSIQMKNILKVSNLHFEREGSFMVLITEDKKNQSVFN